jgi:hypothetical protein
MKAWREEIRSMRFETTNTRKEAIACQEMEARLEEEPVSVDIKPEAGTTGSRRRRHRDAV